MSTSPRSRADDLAALHRGDHDGSVAQLKPGGRMIIPLERVSGDQDLVLIEKDTKGRVSREKILPVLFVPLTGEHLVRPWRLGFERLQPLPWT